MRPRSSPLAWIVCCLAFGAAARDSDLQGVVVDSVGPGSVLEEADLRPGDAVVGWSFGTGSGEDGRGEIASPFEWEWVALEQAPRGILELHGERQGEPLVLSVRPGTWQARVRPRMTAPLLERFLEGRKLIEEGSLEEGVESWRRLAGSVEDARLSWWLHLRTSEAWAAAQSWEEASEANRRAVARAWDPRVEAASRRALGKAAMGQGELARAEAWLGEALALERKLEPASLHVADALNLLGFVAYNRGELAGAESHIREALEIRSAISPDSRLTAGSLNNLGTVAVARGDLDRAEEYFRRALAIKESHDPESVEVANSMNNLGLVAAERGEFELAEDHFKRALAIKEKLAPESLQVAASFINLGKLAKDRGKFELAEERFGRALSIYAERTPSGFRAAHAYSNLGSVVEQRDPGRARRYYELALSIYEKLAPESTREANALYRLGILAREEGNTDRAAGHFVRAVDSLEGQIRKLGGSSDYRARFRSHYRPMYRDAIGASLDLGRSEEAFHLLERSRAGSFLAMLAERDLVFAADVPAELESARRSLASRYDRTLRRMTSLDAEKDAGRIEEILSRLEELHRQRDDVEGRIRAASPRLADLRYPRPLAFEQARSVLDPGTVMLSYNVDDDATDLFVVTRSRPLRREVLGVGESELREDVRLFLELVRRTRPGTGFWKLDEPRLRALAKRLYGELVGPVEALVEDGERLLVVPDGPLHLLPFGALIRAAEDGPGERFLVESRPIHFVLSATVYAELAKLRPSGGGSTPIELVAFGDPDYSRRGQPRRGQLRRGRRAARGEAALERGTTDLLNWEPLPHTRREIERIAGHYAPAAVRTYFGAEATEERAKSVGREARILHFAAHGHFDPRLPLSSFLALSIPPKPSEGRDNGLLQVWEIFEDVRLDADLVVLSACGSALGVELGGEGLIGFTRAFQYAGARSVAATLWSVEDEATAELMAAFYRHLRSGRPKDEALRLAQIELIRGSEATSAPYFWAAFQIFGDRR